MDSKILTGILIIATVIAGTGITSYIFHDDGTIVIEYDAPSINGTDHMVITLVPTGNVTNNSTEYEMTTVRTNGTIDITKTQIIRLTDEHLESITKHAREGNE